MNGETTRELRLSSRGTHEGTVEVRFLQATISLTPDQARELQRELTHSIAIAEHGQPRRYPYLRAVEGGALA